MGWRKGFFAKLEIPILDPKVVCGNQSVSRTTAEWSNRKSKTDKRASLGVMIDDNSNGVTIGDVLKDSAADKAGLQEGDVINRFNDKLLFY